MNAEILSPLSPRKNTLSGVWWTREGFCAKSVVARLPPRFSFLFFTLAPRANLRERGASHTSLSTKKTPSRVFGGRERVFVPKASSLAYSLVFLFTSSLSLLARTSVYAELLTPLSPQKNTLSGVWWTREGSNLRPLPCQGSALTN